MGKALQWAAVVALGGLGAMMLAGTVPVLGLGLIGFAGYRAYHITRPHKAA